MDLSIFLLFFLPGLIALVAAGLGVFLFTKLRSATGSKKVALWVGIILCTLTALGIGTCYAWCLRPNFLT